MMMSMLFPLWFGLIGGIGGLGRAPVADSPETVRAYYEAAAAHLDAGGDFYAVNHVAGQALYNLEKMELMFNLNMQQDKGKAALSERIKEFLTAHGALTTHTLAASTVPRTDGVRDIKCFVGRNPAARTSHFWRGLVGNEPRSARHLPVLPKQTVLALETSMEAAQLWSIVRDGMLRFACNGNTQKLQQMLADARAEIGVDLDTLFEGLGHDLTLSVLFDPDKKVTLPGRNGGVTIPEPGFLILVGASNDAPLTFVRKFFEEKGAALVPVETEFGTLYRLPEMLPRPLPMQFAALMHENTLYLASTPRLIREQMTAEKDARLGGSERFRKVYGDLPPQGNLFFYCDARFRTTFNHVRDTMASRHGGPAEAAVFMGMLMPGTLPDASSGWVLVNRPEGLLLTGTGTGGFIRQAISGNAGAYAPLMMGIAIPSMVQSRSRAQRAACINNLRQLDAAKQQWALDTGAARDAEPKPEELNPYLQGGVEALKCPEGGTYSINPLNQKPTCSIPGHQIR